MAVAYDGNGGTEEESDELYWHSICLFERTSLHKSLLGNGTPNHKFLQYPESRMGYQLHKTL